MSVRLHCRSTTRRSSTARRARDAAGGVVSTYSRECTRPCSTSTTGRCRDCPAWKMRGRITGEVPQPGRAPRQGGDEGVGQTLAATALLRRRYGDFDFGYIDPSRPGPNRVLHGRQRAKGRLRPEWLGDYHEWYMQAGGGRTRRHVRQALAVILSSFPTRRWTTAGPVPPVRPAEAGNRAGGVVRAPAVRAWCAIYTAGMTISEEADRSVLNHIAAFRIVRRTAVGHDLRLHACRCGLSAQC